MWFLNRWKGSWQIFSVVVIIFLHFVFPFFILASQPSKMNGTKLKVMAVWLLVVHFLDLYWIIFPTFSPEGVMFGWIEIGFLLLAFGLVLLVFTLKAKNNNLIPIGDPKLQRGIDFRL